MRWTLLFGILILLATLKVASMPEYNFDGYMYSYLAQRDLATFKVLPELPPEYVAMPDATYRQQIPYYKVKPLFNLLVRAVVPVKGVLRAPSVVSVVAYFALAWAVWLWLRALSVAPMWRSLASLLIMFSSVVTDTCRAGTPDALCAALTLWGAYLLFSTRTPIAGVLVLCGSIFTRPDAIILNGLLLIVGFSRGRLAKRSTVTLGLMMLVSYFAASRGGYRYGQLVAWTLRTSYFHAFTHNFAKTELAVYAPFILLGLFAAKLRFQNDILLALLASLLIRYVSLPHLEIRYLLPQAVIVAVIGSAAIFAEEQEHVPTLARAAQAA